MKKCSTSLIIREIHSKITMSYHFTRVIMANINKSGNNRCWPGCGATGSLLHCWWECKLAPPLWKTAWRFLKKLKAQRPYEPAIARLGIYPRDMGALFPRGTCTQTPPKASSSTINNSQRMERARMSIDAWNGKRRGGTYRYNGTLRGDRKEKQGAIRNDAATRRGYSPQRNESEKDNYHMTSLI